jgi:indole-3-glycerol phosphate synthase
MYTEPLRILLDWEKGVLLRSNFNTKYNTMINEIQFLDTICHSKRLEIASQKETVPLSELKNILNAHFREKVSFKEALTGSVSGIIAEFKRKSPSKGWIYPDADVAQIVQSYEAGGAAAISCLTDEPFFGGGFTDFQTARETIKRIPLLRKDFIIDEYQLYQSKALGADVVLLIVACLTAEEVARFTAIAHELDMETLVEIHEEAELTSICPDADVIGINNRNLKTFVTDIQSSIDLASRIPGQFVKISESGLSRPETVIQLRQAGFKGFLMGENFMKTPEPGKTLREFIQKLQ